jgi:hypothetical protein
MKTVGHPTARRDRIGVIANIDYPGLQLKGTGINLSIGIVHRKKNWNQLEYRLKKLGLSLLESNLAAVLGGDIICYPFTFSPHRVPRTAHHPHCHLGRLAMAAMYCLVWVRDLPFFPYSTYIYIHTYRAFCYCLNNHFKVTC